MTRISGLVAALGLALSSFSGPLPVAEAIATAAKDVPTQVRVVSIYPHNTTAFTEGFFYLDGAIIESTGLERQSFIRQYKLQHPADIEAVVTVRRSDDDDDEDDATSSDDDDDDDAPATGETRMLITRRPASHVPSPVLQEYQFSPEIFGEGIAAIGDKIYALTYKRNKILVLSKSDFRLLETHPFHSSTGEGWGMTTDGKFLIVSDGSASVQFYDPQRNFTRVRSIDVVNDSNETVPQINELEWVDGEILANVWFKNVILRIDPTDGRVIEELNLEWVPAMVPNLVSMADMHMKGEAVMNGIAFNPKNRHVYITGKLWDSIFELELSYLKAPRHAA